MFKRFKFCITVFLVTISCTKETNPGNTNTYNKKPLLNSIVENNIIPAYEELKSDLEVYDDNVSLFVASPNQSNLDNVRASHVEAYTSWQYVEMFNIGKASSIGYRGDLNTYKTNIEDIHDIIDETFTSPITDIDYSRAFLNDAQGFPALDYIFYGDNLSDGEIIDLFISNQFAANYKIYVKDISSRMLSLTSDLINDWNSSKEVFINDNTNTATSSFNLLINDYIYYIEKGFREPKLVKPAGLRADVDSNTDNLESRFNPSITKVLYEASFDAIVKIYNGTPFSSEKVTPVGLNTYLDDLNATITLDNGDEVSLSSYISETLIKNIKTKNTSLNSDFSSHIENDTGPMNNAFVAIQELVVAIKVNVLEAFSVDVDYVDSDGD